MKTNTTSRIVLGILVLMGVFSFGVDKYKPVEEQFVYVPQGALTTETEVKTIEGFWILDHEVTNAEYNDFLLSLREQGRDDDYELAKRENQNWVAVLGKENEAYKKYYGHHGAYADYPVVNISYEAANLYCNWLSAKSEYEFNYALPTKSEWIYAAQGGLSLVSYSWGGHLLKNRRGEKMCNYMEIGDHRLHRDKNNAIVVKENTFSSRSMFIMPSESFLPNAYEIYNTCGNVAEMIKTKGVAMGGSWNDTGYDVRVESEKEYDMPSPFVGFRPIRKINKEKG